MLNSLAYRREDILLKRTSLEKVDLGQLTTINSNKKTGIKRRM